MIVAHYIGKHEKDSLLVRLGWFLTRLTQVGRFRDATHAEAILERYDDGSVLIGSASLREGGVRLKRCKLNEASWRMHNVKCWDEKKSLQWFIDHAGMPYDKRGALATVIPAFGGNPNAEICHGSIGHSVGFDGAHMLTCSEFEEVTHHLAELIA